MNSIILRSGLKYRTRSGSVVIISDNNYPMNKDLYPFIGVDIHSKFSHSYTSKGYFLYSESYHHYDIIEQIV